jgi:hypothetical protein
MLLLNDPKASPQMLLDILNKKMADLSAFTYADRVIDPSTKLPSIDIDTCSVLQLVAKGFAMEAKFNKDPNTFDRGRFISFVRKQTNYKDLTKEKGFEFYTALRGSTK